MHHIISYHHIRIHPQNYVYIYINTHARANTNAFTHIYRSLITSYASVSMLHVPFT